MKVILGELPALGSWHCGAGQVREAMPGGLRTLCWRSCGTSLPASTALPIAAIQRTGFLRNACQSPLFEKKSRLFTCKRDRFATRHCVCWDLGWKPKCAAFLGACSTVRLDKGRGRRGACPLQSEVFPWSPIQNFLPAPAACSPGRIGGSAPGGAAPGRRGRRSARSSQALAEDGQEREGGTQNSAREKRGGA